MIARPPRIADFSYSWYQTLAEYICVCKKMETKDLVAFT